MSRITIQDETEAFDAPPPAPPEPEPQTPPAADAHDFHTARRVPLSSIVESPSNPRKAFTGIDELAGSIIESGLLQPLVVRPAPGAPEKYELVFGHRRLRALGVAGFTEAPVMVRDLSDEEVLEEQLVENVHRADLHPLEQAAGLKDLHEKHGWSVEQLAARIGKSRASVYASLKLLELTPRAQQMFLAGKLSASTALLVARIPDEKLQLEAAKVIAEGRYEQGPMSVRDAEELVQREYMLKLEGTPFDASDGELVPAAGPCITCPKRTGAQPELFRDVKTDLCTDPGCYREKVSADWRAKEAAAKAGTGPKTVSATESARIFQGTHLRFDASYVRAEDQCQDDEKFRTYRQLLGKSAQAHVVLARTPEGEVVELLPKQGLKRALDDAGRIKRRERAPAEHLTKEAKAEREAEEKKAAIAEAARKMAIAVLVSMAEEKEPDIRWWRLVVTLLADGAEDLPARRGLDDSWRSKWIAKLNIAGLRGAAFELLLEHFGRGDTFELACDAMRVSLKDLRAKAKAELKQQK